MARLVVRSRIVSLLCIQPVQGEIWKNSVKLHKPVLTHLSLLSFMWDIGKKDSPRCDAAEHGVSSGAILFAQRNFDK